MSGEFDVPRTHPDLGEYVARWEAAAATFRSRARGELDVPYGVGEAERIDFFEPDEAPDAVVLFFHGGFWVEGSRTLYSHLAAGPLAHGTAVGMVGYDLAPAVELAVIVEQTKAAVAFAAERTALPVVVAGHSAGAHLAAMAVADAAVPTSHGVAISGVFDLEALLGLPLNKLLRLDAATARRLSPIRLDPPAATTLRLVVGGDEGEEWHRQSRAMAERWGTHTELHTIPGRHHLSVIEGLADPDGALAHLCRAAADRAAP
jgi:arylformamidase